jgi:hypothetical protein
MLGTRATAHPVITAPERGSQSPQHSPDRNGTASDAEQEERPPVDSPLRIGASSLDFFLSGRSLGAWITGLAFISASLGAVEIIGVEGTQRPGVHAQTLRPERVVATAPGGH